MARHFVCEASLCDIEQWETGRVESSSKTLPFFENMLHIDDKLNIQEFSQSVALINVEISQ